MILATLCYVDNGKEYLLLHRNKKENDIHQGKWIGVGGKFEKGETPQDCVKREVLEETGLTLDEVDLRGFILFPNFDGKNDWGVFVFTATQFHGELLSSDEGELEWVAYEDVDKKPTWQGDKLFLEWLLTGKPFFSAKIVYDNSEMIGYAVDFKKE